MVLPHNEALYKSQEYSFAGLGFGLGLERAGLGLGLGLGLEGACYSWS